LLNFRPIVQSGQPSGVDPVGQVALDSVVAATASTGETEPAGDRSDYLPDNLPSIIVTARADGRVAAVSPVGIMANPIDAALEYDLMSNKRLFPFRVARIKKNHEDSLYKAAKVTGVELCYCT
jgi:hypothetical protein